jgi:hypothetical protein
MFTIVVTAMPALAQAEWVLIAPPIPGNWRDDPRNASVQHSAPLSAWRRVGTFRTREECEARKRIEADIIEASPDSPMHKAFLLARWAGYRCVTADALKPAP